MVRLRDRSLGVKPPAWTSPENLALQDPEPRIHPTAELKSCRLGRYASIGERVILREVMVGDFSYFERHAEAIYTTIGKFCSIAANSRINALEHPLERLTSTRSATGRTNIFAISASTRRSGERRQATARHHRPRRLDRPWRGGHAGRDHRQWRGRRRQCGGDARCPALRDRRRRFRPSRCASVFAEKSLRGSKASAWWDWPVEKLAEAVPDMQALSDRGVSRPLGARNPADRLRVC